MSSLSTILVLGFFFVSDCLGTGISWGNWDIMLMILVTHNLLAHSDIVPPHSWPHLRSNDHSSVLMVPALNSLDDCYWHENWSRSIVRCSVLVTLCVIDVSQSSQTCSTREGKTLVLTVSIMVSVPTLLWCFVVTFRITSSNFTVTYRWTTHRLETYRWTTSPTGAGTGERVVPTGSVNDKNTEVTERKVLDSITQPNEHTFR
jgi:hypothetical protein